MKLSAKHIKARPRKFLNTLSAPHFNIASPRVSSVAGHIRGQLESLNLYDSGGAVNKDGDDFFPLRQIPTGFSLYRCLSPEFAKRQKDNPFEYIGLKIGRETITANGFPMTLKDYARYIARTSWYIDFVEGCMPEDILAIYQSVVITCFENYPISEKNLSEITPEDIADWKIKAVVDNWGVLFDSANHCFYTAFNAPSQVIKYIFDYAVYIHGLLSKSPIDSWICDWIDMQNGPIRGQVIDILKFSPLGDVGRYHFELLLDSDGKLKKSNSFFSLKGKS
jgi:hypothetical protein